MANSTATVNATDIRFGLELETTMPLSNAPVMVQRRSWESGSPVEWMPEGWTAMTDSSIHSSHPGRIGREFVSPILRGAEGLESVRKACDAIKSRGGKVNSSCGVHVTVSFPETDAPALARLIHLVANHEKALYASTGTRNREMACWAKRVKLYGCEERAKQAASRDRYHLLNLTHIARGNGRVEIRVFSGSLNDDKICAWIQLVLGLVELALSSRRRQSWDYAPKSGKPGPWGEGNNGETEMRRLFYRLGWTKGHAKKQFGIVDPESLKKSKSVLLDMARKYDRGA